MGWERKGTDNFRHEEFLTRRKAYWQLEVEPLESRLRDAISEHHKSA
jgi:hypothetical protein